MHHDPNSVTLSCAAYARGGSDVSVFMGHSDSDALTVYGPPHEESGRAAPPYSTSL
jgi:hypothetical protein